MRFARMLIAAAYLVLAGVVLVGCGPIGGFQITPVPSDQTLEEREVEAEPGLFRPKIALIDVNGLIMDAGDGGLFGERENPVSLFKEKLRAAEMDKGVRAVILRINSPGGGVTASDLMYQELLEFKRHTGKPVIAMLMDVAASGGYYLACAADEIDACPTTVTGSIGVIMQLAEFSGTMEKLGITANAITSGRHKDTGSPFRPMRPEERELFQALVNRMYERFLAVVTKGRPNLTTAKVRELADGRVYLADQALENGLIDRVGTFPEVIKAAKARASLGSAAVRVVMYARPLGWRSTYYARSPGSDGGTTVNLLNLNLPDGLRDSPRFLYLWRVGA